MTAIGLATERRIIHGLLQNGWPLIVAMEWRTLHGTAIILMTVLGFATEWNALDKMDDNTWHCYILKRTRGIASEWGMHLILLHTKVQHLALLQNKGQYLALFKNKEQHLALLQNKGEHLALLQNKEQAPGTASE
jgi:hypothetical protein